MVYPKHTTIPDIPEEQYGIIGLDIIDNPLQCVTFKDQHTVQEIGSAASWQVKKTQ